MALLIGEFYHLILNGRTVPGASPLDGPGKQWGTVQIFPDDLMGLFVGIRKPAGDLLSLHRLRIRGEGKRNDPFISKLLLHL